LPITVAITGGAGQIGSAVRAGLAREDFRIRAIDVVPMTDGATEDDARVVDLRDASATESALQASDAIVHLAAHPAEATFEEIHRSNVLTTYNVYEAARHLGIKRVVFASTVHVSGFYSWGRITSPSDPPRPDTYYALSKLYGEGLGSMYADRYGLEVVNLRIVAFSLEPTEPAHLWGWLSPADAVRLVAAALTAPAVHIVTCYGLSRNTRRFYTDDGWGELRLRPTRRRRAVCSSVARCSTSGATGHDFHRSQLRRELSSQRGSSRKSGQLRHSQQHRGIFQRLEAMAVIGPVSIDAPPSR
jgi:uronate dehydrogenase